eukprot:424344_1
MDDILEFWLHSRHYILDEHCQLCVFGYIRHNSKNYIPDELSMICLQYFCKHISFITCTNDKHIDSPINASALNVMDNIQKIKSDFNIWNDIHENTNTYKNKEFTEKTYDIKQTYKQINRTLKEMNKFIEKQEEEWSDSLYSTSELNDINQFTKDMKSYILHIRRIMQSDKIRSILEQHKKLKQIDDGNVLHRSQVTGNSGYYDYYHHLNTSDIHGGEKPLPSLDVSVQQYLNVDINKHVVNVMNGSQDQYNLLMEIDDEMNISYGRCHRITAKTRKRLCIVIVLIVVCVVLIVVFSV